MTPLHISCDHPQLLLSPYVWKSRGADQDARIEATMPGAYIRAIVANTTNISLVIDATANAGCPPESMPVLEYSIDHAPFIAHPVINAGEIYSLQLSTNLDRSKPHAVEVHFRAADLSRDRWRSTSGRLRLAGLQADSGASLIRPASHAKRALGFGDSITEGVGVDAHLNSSGSERGTTGI